MNTAFRKIYRGFYRLALLAMFFVSIAAAVHGISNGRSHDFSEDSCLLCHEGNEPDKNDIKENIAGSCGSCHTKLEEKKSHPSNVYPTMHIPEDMPLSKGRLTCITCHFVHPKEGIKLFSDENNFLRRQTRGIFFCNICHQIDKENHIVRQDIHTGTYKVTDSSSRIDSLSLECIECHDTYLKTPAKELGAGSWNHFNKALNHPIGIDYSMARSKEPQNFRAPNMFDNEVRLYNGKIGCGTCHNIYSSDKSMLVIDNYRSRLCFQCHIK